jgi:CheY-like chemotaxis protein
MLNAHILVAEDNEVNLEVTTRMLDAFGCRFTSAENGLIALEKWRSGQYDAILMDFQMPVMDGMTATRRIRAEERERGLPPIPIAAVTANAFDDDKAQAIDAGCDAFLSKPISRKRLFDMLEKMLTRRARVATQQLVTAEHAVAEVAAPSGELPVDMAMIEEIRALGNPLLLKRMVEIYLVDSQKKLQAIRETHGRGDARGLMLAAHALKSGTTSLGGREVVALCRELEACGKSGAVPSSIESLDRLDERLKQFCDALRRLIAEEAA